MPTSPQDDDYQSVKAAAFQPNTAAASLTQEKRRVKWLWPVAALALMVLVMLILFRLRPVYLEIEPESFDLETNYWLSLHVGHRLFIPAGHYRLMITSEGYQSLEVEYQVQAQAQAQTLNLQLQKKPGQISIQSEPEGALVRLNGEALGKTPLEAEIPAGNQRLLLSHEPLYLPKDVTLEVIGLGEAQSLAVALEPNYGQINLQSVPEAAEVWIDDQKVGLTPGQFKIGAGGRVILISHPDYQEHRFHVEITAGQQLTSKPIILRTKPVTVTLNSVPAGTNVLVNGRYLGVTPLKLPMVADETYDLLLQKAGFENIKNTYKLADVKQRTLHFQLQPVEGDVVLKVRPKHAEVFVDDVLVGQGSRTLRLASTLHKIKVTAKGYADHTTKVLPQHDVSQHLQIQLLLIEEQRRRSLPLTYQNAQQQSFRLVQPGRVMMGGKRTEPGFQFDQQRRDVQLPTLFYVGLHEVTNSQYKAFYAAHNSGTIGRLNLDVDTHPVVQVTWLDAIRYCNWLSAREKLKPAYQILSGNRVIWYQNANGYRLLTESEWAWVARQPEGSAPILFPWGNQKLVNAKLRTGNYAEYDEKAGTRRDLPIAYRDGFKGTAPVGQFNPNPLGVFDLGGNVSEWVYNYFSVDSDTGYAGPVEATETHVIRGSSWQHGFVRELRLAFRRPGSDATPDVGFRLARTP